MRTEFSDVATRPQWPRNTRHSNLFSTLVLMAVSAIVLSTAALAQNASPILQSNGDSTPVNCLVPEAGAPSCTIQTSPGSSTIDPATPQHVGNPINVVTGNKYQYELDYQSINSGLALTRHYNSSLTDYDTGFGSGWRHTYQVVLTRVSDKQIDIVQSDGRLIHFYQDSGNSSLYLPQAGTDGRIETGNTSVWQLDDGRRMLFQGSFLISIDMGASLGQLRLSYSQGKLHTVTDSKGDSLLFEYNIRSTALPQYGSGVNSQPDDAISSITLPSGQVIKYQYGNHRNLISAAYSNKDTLHYEYQNSEWRSHLTHRTSTTDKRSTYWSYDSNGRAVTWNEENGNNGLTIIRSPQEPDGDVNNGASQQLAHTLVTYNDNRETKYTWKQPQHTALPDARYHDFTCDNCLPKKADFSSNKNTLIKDTKSKYSVAMDSLWLSLTRAKEVGPAREGISKYQGEYPHERGNVTIELSTSRVGNVLDVTIGNLPLVDIVRLSTDENSPECSEGIHFVNNTNFSYERIQRLGSGDAPCTLDSAVAVEFIHTIENLKSANKISSSHTKKDQKTTPSVPWHDPMRRYCSLPAGMNCTDLEDDLRMARLSQCAYGQVNCEPEFRLVDPTKIRMRADRFDNLGFNAELYHDDVRNRYVLAFRGTDNIGDDWDANFEQARGQRTRQYDLAYNLAVDVSSRIGGADLEVTGHSLGGGLATIAALATNSSSTVFNAAALQPSTAALYGLSTEYQNANTNIRHIHTDFDPVTVLQERADDLNWGDMQTVPGIQLEVPNPDHPWMQVANLSATSFIQSLPPVLWHKIEAVIHVLQSLLNYKCAP